MHLGQLNLLQFKNYGEASLQFSPHINLITGDNGSGKTNLLDAVHYLCLTKSAFHSQDAQAIAFGHDFFALTGEFEHEGQANQVHLAFHAQQGKTLRLGKKAYERMSEHVGRFPCVMATPYDTDLVREGSEVRRKFFDGVLCQANHAYLDQLMRYNRLLQQRNSLLKQFAERHYTDRTMLEAYDTQLLPLAQHIYRQRAEFTDAFVPVFAQCYAHIAGSHEPTGIAYLSELAQPDFAEAFAQNLPRDLAAQHTTKGIHKDDYIFTINHQSVKKFASQGQQKSFVLALRLAQMELMAQLLQRRPLLLLDDIFDKLDDQRIARLVALMASPGFGQVFVTDARPERSRAQFASLPQPPRTIYIANGQVSKVEA